MGPDLIHLLLDSYFTHRTNEAKATAATLRAILHYIPPSLTDEFGLLDRTVFGVLKAEARRLSQARFQANFSNSARNKRASQT
jgi:hypothetical protein